MKEVLEFLKNCGTYYLATMEGNQPRVRPFGTIDMFEDKLYFQTAKVKDVSKQLQANPKFELSGMLGDKWIRVQAVAIIDERVVAKQHMLDAYPSLLGMYKADDGNIEVFYLTNATATISSHTEAPKVIQF